MRYFDTGVLLKLYLPEPRAAEAVAFVNASPGKPPVNSLHELEMRSALRQKAGRGELTQTECVAIIGQVQFDLATDEAEAAEVKAEAAKLAAIALTTSRREENYKRAQSSVGLIEGALGKDHPAALRARGIRASMTNPHTQPAAPSAP